MAPTVRARRPSLSICVLIVCLVVSLLATKTKSLLVYERDVLFNILDSFGKLPHVMSGEQALGLPPHLAMVPEELRRHEPIRPTIRLAGDANVLAVRVPGYM